MKKSIYSLLLLSVILAACTPSQKITSTWINTEALPKGPFQKIFLLSIIQDVPTRLRVENELDKLFIARGKKTVKSLDLFPPDFSPNSAITKDLMVNAIKRSGCDAVFTITLLDVKSEEYYQSGTSYMPLNHGYYGSYYNYYDHFYPQIYTPGYYVNDKTYFIETNFYEVATDQLLFSIQSSSYNPTSLEKWFSGYSSLLLSKLKYQGLIKK